MKRPAGTKSISEIRQLPRPEDRLTPYATLLEWVLRDLVPDSNPVAKLNALIEIHAKRFRNVKRVYHANAVRNDLTHANGEYSRPDWDKASTIFDEAILSAAEGLPSDLQREIFGDLEREPPAADSRQASSAYAPASGTPIEAEFRLLYFTGNIVWPDEVAYAEKYPFTDEAADAFLSKFNSETIVFDPEVKSIYLRFAKSNLPHHSYADGFLYAQTINEIREGERWPEAIADIRLEYGGPLAGPVIKVKKRADDRADFRSRFGEKTVPPSASSHGKSRDSKSGPKPDTAFSSQTWEPSVKTRPFPKAHAKNASKLLLMCIMVILIGAMLFLVLNREQRPIAQATDQYTPSQPLNISSITPIPQTTPDPPQPAEIVVPETASSAPPPAPHSERLPDNSWEAFIPADGRWHDTGIELSCDKEPNVSTNYYKCQGRCGPWKGTNDSGTPMLDFCGRGPFPPGSYTSMTYNRSPGDPTFPPGRRDTLKCKVESSYQYPFMLFTVTE